MPAEKDTQVEHNGTNSMEFARTGLIEGEALEHEGGEVCRQWF